jgi:hypothetical protein
MGANGLAGQQGFPQYTYSGILPEHTKNLREQRKTGSCAKHPPGFQFSWFSEG